MKTKLKTLMHNANDFSGFREADKIINYLKDPSGKTQLNSTLRKKLDLYTIVYNLRLQFKQNSHIVGILTAIHKRSQKQARIDICETEYIFGKVMKIDVLFEKNFMLEASRKNLEIAYLTKDNDKISKALKVHKEIVGEELSEAEMPDFSKFESHTYNIVLPPQILELIKQLMGQGAINLTSIIPAKMVQHALSQIEEAKEVTDGD
jgi:hypothetical protein